MSNVSYQKSREKIIYLTQKTNQILRKKGKVSIARLAWLLGYTSPPYFRRSVLPMLQMLSDCIKVDQDTVVWTCYHEELSKEDLDTKDELSILAAKPVDEEPKASEVEWGGSE